VARAVRSPRGLVVGGAAGAVAVVTGLGVPLGLGVAALGWLASVTVAALWRSPRPPAPDPFAVGEPWRRYVMAAVRHQRRFTDACADLPDGPLRQRLGTLGLRVDDAVAEIWDIAQAGHRVGRARRSIGPAAPPSALPPPVAAEAAATHEETAARLADAVASTEQRLASLDAQLGAAVTRAIEITATAGTSAEFGDLEGDLTRLVDEMDALRLAVLELDPGPPTPPDTSDRTGTGEQGTPPGTGEAAPGREGDGE